MKNIIEDLLISVLMVITWYSIFAFILWQPNPQYWQEGRFICIIFCVGSTFGILAEKYARANK